jgi:hypothetical protein
MDLKIEDFRDWTPARIFENESGFFVDWFYLGRQRLTEPFYDDTLELRLREPFNLLFQRRTPFAFLVELYEKSPGIAPNGFIFHISRCGSTLVSRMLAALEKNIVVSEASVTDKLIRAENLPDEKKAFMLRRLFSALAQKRFPAEENFFVKFDSWSVLDLPLIERAFPKTPWVFLYRDPVEVIVSNMREPGMQMIPAAIGKIFPGMDLYEILQFSTEERFARTIAAFCRTALEHSGGGKFVNYTQLPEAVTDGIGRRFGLSLNSEEIEKMRAGAKFHAKRPQQEFSPDSDQKKKEASPEVVRTAEKHAAPLYERLEDLRLRQAD